MNAAPEPAADGFAGDWKGPNPCPGDVEGGKSLGQGWKVALIPASDSVTETAARSREYICQNETAKHPPVDEAMVVAGARLSRL